ncbi:SMI1/KNR4 family protein [Vibrio sp. YMD68]|uniref:SMI1/KNR4 family protein n=1 Tax=Vibrio sp. YMD68 TaxID=3042300 RepID=UPI00249B7BF3|nr:SMI1/KNR4 family protein [Vibrio sp. YMD68]WGV98807.1 SMI1/KNR4 family protein [Vibrio sp. YMD68]
MSVSNLTVFHDFGECDLSILESFETRLGIEFPMNYKEFIQKHNGASLVNEYFRFFCKRQDVFDSTGFYFLGFGSSEGLISSILDILNNQDYDVYGYEGLVSFGRNGSGDYVCFDYRNISVGSEPSIIFMLHDAYDEDGKMTTFYVAESFDVFCGLLFEL